MTNILIIIAIIILIIFAIVVLAFMLKLDQILLGGIIKREAEKERLFVNIRHNEFIKAVFKAGKKANTDVSESGVTYKYIYHIEEAGKRLYLNEKYEVSNSLDKDKQPNIDFWSKLFDPYLKKRFEVALILPGLIEILKYSLKWNKFENSLNGMVAADKSEIVDSVLYITTYLYKIEILLKEDDKPDSQDVRVELLINVVMKTTNPDIALTKILPVGSYVNKLGSLIEESLNRYSAEEGVTFAKVYADVADPTKGTSDLNDRIMSVNKESKTMTGLKIISIDSVKLRNVTESGLQEKKEEVAKAVLDAEIEEKKGIGEAKRMDKVTEAIDNRSKVYKKIHDEGTSDLFKTDTMANAIKEGGVTVLGGNVVADITK